MIAFVPGGARGWRLKSNFPSKISYVDFVGSHLEVRSILSVCCACDISLPHRCSRGDAVSVVHNLLMK